MSIGSFRSRSREKVSAWVRRDRLVLLLFVVAIPVMTYPLAFRPAEGLPMSGRDILTAQWQVWWLGEILKNGHDPNYTPYLFHPNGLDVTFQPRRWAALGTWLPLRLLLGDIVGYNVSVLLGLLVSAYTAYLLILALTDNRAAAWIGGAFFAFYPGHLVRVFRQPNTGSIQWLPLFMLALVVGLRRVATSPESRRCLSRRDLARMLLASLALALSAYISIKPWLQAALLGTLYVSLAALVEGWWRRAVLWKALGLLAVCSLLFALPVLSPYLFAGSGIQNAINQNEEDLADKGIDLLSTVKAAPELGVFMPKSLARLMGTPFTTWQSYRSVYVGMVSILLVVLGLIDSAKQDRQRPVWLVLGLVFWGLSLGTRLRVDQVKYSDIWTPYRLVEGILLFRVARIPYRFTLGFSLPWAVMVGYGVAHLWRRLEGRRWLARGLVGCLGVLMIFELAEVPVPLRPPEVSPFHEQLRAEGEEGAIIDLPMWRSEAKIYMYQQTIHHRPIVEGAIARMPENAYDYVDANPLLRAWRKKEPLTCSYDVEKAISDLQADDFRYIVVHERSKHRGRWLDDYFITLKPVYQDKFITVFTLADLQANPPCESRPDEGS